MHAIRTRVWIVTRACLLAVSFGLALLPALCLVMSACGDAGSADDPPERVAPPHTMSLQEFRARVGVACITPDLLPAAFEKLPIGFYKDYHPLGFAHHDAAWAEGTQFQPYVPTIQWAGIGDSPEFREMLRQAAASGQYPTPEGVEADDLIALLELAALEAWLIERTNDGTFAEGTLFCMGNEPGYQPNYDTRTPQQIVEDAIRLRNIFERHDLGHLLCLGGISSPDNAYQRRAYGGLTPMAFFEAVLEEAQGRDFTFDVFMIHPYPFDQMELPDGLPDEADAAVFTNNSIAQVRAMREIMARFDHRDTPLIIGETGMPFAIGSDPAKLAADYADGFLSWCVTATDDELGSRDDGGRLVQRFIWFLLSVPDEPVPGITDHPIFVWEHTVLMTPDGELTPLGERFNDVATRLCTN